MQALLLAVLIVIVLIIAYNVYVDIAAQENYGVCPMSDCNNARRRKHAPVSPYEYPFSATDDLAYVLSMENGPSTIGTPDKPSYSATTPDHRPVTN
jgi:hypothetical protein